MTITLKKTDEQWSRLATEVLILSTACNDLYLQYLCDLVNRVVKPVQESYEKKRIELIKKHGEKQEGDNYLVKQYPEYTEEQRKAEGFKEEELPAYTAFSEEFKPIREHETTLTIECIEAELFRSQNPKEFRPLFVQVGAPVGIFGFHELFTITDKAASLQPQ